MFPAFNGIHISTIRTSKNSSVGSVLNLSEGLINVCPKKYRQQLSQRVENTFQEWKQEKNITESELYQFLHKLMGTAGTIGLHRLSEFCESQLEILSADSEIRIPVGSLENFINRIQVMIVEEMKDSEKEQVKKVPLNRFDEETLVLLIDDDLEFVSYVKELLEGIGAQVMVALNGKRGIEQFYSMKPNYVLIDLRLPDMLGFDVIDQIKETAAERQVTLAIASVDASIENRKKAYEHDAMDFVKKPIEPEIFIAYMLNRDRMRRTHNASIILDSLTGIGNRRNFDERIYYHKEMYHRSGIPFTLVIIDLDGFKQINDEFGHPAGDDVLRAFGELLRSEKREIDECFRYGGEEFTLLLPNTNETEAQVLVDRLRQKFNNLKFTEGDSTFQATFSSGIATYEENIEQMVKRADQALYVAKRTGRNKTVIFNENQMKTKRQLHIIIVDDDVLVRTILEQELLKWTNHDFDLSVQVFPNGPSFLQADWYKPEEKYIVLLDGIMPEMDGLEVLSRLKQDKEKKNILVSMMTARTGDADIKAALWLGADDYMMKPFQPKEVLARIQQLTKRLFK